MSINSLPYPTKEISLDKPGFLSAIGAAAITDIPAEFDPFTIFDFQINFGAAFPDTGQYPNFGSYEVMRFLTYGDSVADSVNVGFSAASTISNDQLGCYIQYPLINGSTFNGEYEYSPNGQPLVNIPAGAGLKPVVILGSNSHSAAKNLFLEGNITAFKPAIFNGYYNLDLRSNYTYSGPITAIANPDLPDGSGELFEGLAVFTAVNYNNVPTFNLSNFSRVEINGSNCSQINLTNCKAELYILNCPNITTQISDDSMSTVYYNNTGLSNFTLDSSTNNLVLINNSQLQSVNLSSLQFLNEVTIRLASDTILDNAINSIPNTVDAATGTLNVYPIPTAASLAKREMLTAQGCSINFLE